VVVFLMVFLSGCAAVGKGYNPPRTQVPASWQGATAGGAAKGADLGQWWRRFQDPVLDDLVTKALAASTDLKTARAQLREARARRDVARAGLGPTVTASASASRSGSDGPGSIDTSGVSTRDLYQAGFDASWEPDVFGGARRGLEAAEADVGASVESLRDVQVSLVAEVARDYTDLRTGEKRLSIAEDNVSAQEELYKLTRWRRQAGLASELDEAQASTLLQQTRASLPALHTAVVEARYSLDILLAVPPGGLQQILKSADGIPKASDRVAVGIPADTLRQRPDVRAAERRLAAQTSRLDQAEAERYPSFRLTGSLGLQAVTLAGLGDTSTHSLLGSITAPIFEAGRIRADIEVQNALLEQARVAYQKTVLTALQDVENALVELSNTGRRRDELSGAVASARQALDLARQQYSAGLVDFQTVLDSERTVLNLEDQLASSTGDHSDALIQLYKALGGGWTPESAAKAQESS
jgi:NodT family efflux transporter outer membrane factor (OMF) lipoprotein